MTDPHPNWMDPEKLAAPHIQTMGTSTEWQADAIYRGFLNRDADEILALKKRVRALEERLAALERDER